MVLKKECCEKCWSGSCGGIMFSTEMDEKQWEEGLVFCPSQYREKGERDVIKTTDKPPSKCPYYLENIL